MGVAGVPRLRIVTALLVALVLVSIVPLALLHFSLIRINRDALETAEKKYLKNSSVTLAESFGTYITNAQSQLKKIADGIRLASSMSTDPFFYLSKKQLLREYADVESSFPVLRALDRDGVTSEADSTVLDPDVERAPPPGGGGARPGGPTRCGGGGGLWWPTLSPPRPSRRARSSSRCPCGPRR